MNSQPNSNYPCFFNNFYTDSRPAYPTYPASYEPVYFDEHENQEYTFLPKSTTFFDNYICTPLDVTRHSTDFTDASDSTPHTHKGISPNSITYPRYHMQDQNIHFQNKMFDQAAKSKFTAVFGAHTGIAFNSFPNGDYKSYKDQSPELSQSDRKLSYGDEKIEEDCLKICKVEDTANHNNEDDEEEVSQHEEIILNTQLRSLLDSKIWSEEKDHTLLKLGAQYKCDWKKISKRFNHKKVTPHFLKIRYKELICAPLQRRVKFNHREDLMIAKYFEKYGSNWAQMATHFKDRTAIMLKNRYYSFIRKRDLLNNLVLEVKDIEKDDFEVDRIRDQDLPAYPEDGAEQNESGLNSVSHQNMGNVCYEMDNFDNELHDKITSTHANDNDERHPIFGNEATFEDSSETELTESLTSAKGEGNFCPQDAKAAKEIETLRAKVKTLQSLYLKTRGELEKIKTQQN